MLLIVNVASKCGFTPQYRGLESLYRTYRDRGFTVLGFPANDFLSQEPGTDAEIAEFCSAEYDVSFPLYSKIVVTGAQKHPLYRALIEARPEIEFKKGSTLRLLLKPFRIGAAKGEVHWNFEKFLVDRSGAVVRRFSTDTEPNDPAVVTAIEDALVH